MKKARQLISVQQQRDNEPSQFEASGFFYILRFKPQISVSNNNQKCFWYVKFSQRSLYDRHVYHVYVQTLERNTWEQKPRGDSI